MILEYLKILLTWPVAVFLLGYIVIHRFSREISQFLRNATSFKAGPVEVKSQVESDILAQGNEEVDRQDFSKDGVTFSKEELEKLTDEYNKLLEDRAQKDKTIDDSRAFISFLVQSVEKYEFLYLNLYLVPNTKFILKWIASEIRVTKNYFDATMEKLKIDNYEREAILNALLNNGLVEQEESNSIYYKITEKGQRFLKFI